MLNKSNPLVAFLIEIVMRMGQKSPKLFVYIQWTAAVVAAIAGIPSFLDGINVHVSGILLAVESKTVAIAALVGLFISMLPVKGDTVAVNPSGEAITMTDQSKLPFTAKVENKAAAVANHPIVPVTNPSTK